MELVRLRDPALTLVLIEVLRQHNIAARREADADEQVLILADAAQYDQARALLQQFLRDPDNPRWQQQAWQQSRPMAESLPSQPLFSGSWFASLGPVTATLLVVCVLVFLSPMVMGIGLYEALLFAPDWATLASQPWRLFSPMLIHFSVLHIIFNLLWWSDLGRTIERFQSSFQLVWVTLVTAAVSNLAQFLHTGPNFGGMSGVVYGLLGYLWLYGKVNPASGYPLRREIVIFMLIWLVVCFVGFADVVANAAHLAGLLSGCALGIMVGLYRRAV